MNCPCSIWGTNVTPTTTDSGDSASIEVGVKFQSDTNGYITGIRFYKASANTGTHIGNLWTSTGQLLASATFTNETASGWQQVNFSQPVAINPNTTYVASYFAPNGHYSEDGAYFYTVPRDRRSPRSPWTARRCMRCGTPTASSTASTPTPAAAPSRPARPMLRTTGWTPSSPRAFTNPPGPVGNVSATAGNASANLTWSAPTSGDPVTTYTITPYIGSTAQTPTTVTGNPAPTSATVSGLTNGTTYTFTVTPSNPAGTGPASSPSNAVTPGVPPAVTGVTPSSGATGVAVSVAPSATFSQPVTPGTVSFTVVDSGGNNVAGSVSFNSADTVATFTPHELAGGEHYLYGDGVGGAECLGHADEQPVSRGVSPLLGRRARAVSGRTGRRPARRTSSDTSAVTLGVQFQATSSGYITGVRFYKEADDTGTHIGSLWTASGTLLASRHVQQ